MRCINGVLARHMFTGVMSKRRRAFDYDDPGHIDAAEQPITAVTGTFAESTYDADGVANVISNASRPGKQSLYPVGRDTAAFEVEPEDVLVTVSRRGRGGFGANALVRSNLAGLDDEVAAEYANDPDQETIVQQALAKKTRFAGLALTKLRGDLGVETNITRLVAGIARLRQGGGKRAVVPGDTIVFRFPLASAPRVLPLSVGHDASGAVPSKVMMEAVPFEPAFVAEDMMANVQTLLRDGDKYRRTLDPRYKSTDVAETAARHTINSALTTGMLFLREAIKAGFVNIDPSFVGYAPSGSAEETALAGTDTAVAVDAMTALMGEFLGVTHSRKFSQDRAIKKKFGVFKRDALGSIFHDPADVTHEVGYIAGSASSLPRFAARYDKSSRLKRGDPYGDFAHEQNNHSMKAWSAVVAALKENDKNAAAVALTGASAKGSGNFFAMIKM